MARTSNLALTSETNRVALPTWTIQQTRRANYGTSPNNRPMSTLNAIKLSQNTYM